MSNNCRARRQQFVATVICLASSSPSQPPVTFHLPQKAVSGHLFRENNLQTARRCICNICNYWSLEVASLTSRHKWLRILLPTGFRLRSVRMEDARFSIIINDLSHRRGQWSVINAAFESRWCCRRYTSRSSTFQRTFKPFQWKFRNNQEFSGENSIDLN